jgi:5-formyltetrahydrofolate cyclo-ligase
LQSKSSLRNRMAAIRDAIPEDQRAAKSAAIAQRLAEWHGYAQAETILAFLSTRSEVMTEAIIGFALVLGKTVAAPRTLLKEKRLDFRRLSRSGPRLAPGPFGIMEPAPDAPAVNPADADLILVPGLAFDEQGYRLGYGGGFYDRLLSEPAVHGASVGIAFEEQMIEQVPRAEGDRPVRWIVTDERVVDCAASQGMRGQT